MGGGFDSSGIIPIAVLGPGSDQAIFSVHVQNNSGTAQSFTAYAECLRATGAKTAYGPEAPGGVNPGASAGVQATCPVGALIAGAFVDTGDTFYLYDYSPSNSSTWQAHLVNPGTVSTVFDLFPQCLSFT